MHPFVMSLIGGMLLGVSASILLLFNGKIAGISGILASLLEPKNNDFFWKYLFFVGLVAGGVIGVHFLPIEVVGSYDSSTFVLILAGLLVGVGTRLANGCTSGHGICGMGRFSLRSIVATITFMSVAALVVFLRLHVFA